MVWSSTCSPAIHLSPPQHRAGWETNRQTNKQTNPNPGFFLRRERMGACVRLSSLSGLTQGTGFCVRDSSLGISQVTKENNNKTTSFIPKKTAPPGHPEYETKGNKANSCSQSFRSTSYPINQTASHARDRAQHSRIGSNSTLDKADCEGRRK